MAKKKGKKRRSYRRKKKGGKKRHTMGIGGRIGACVAGIFPLVVSGAEVVNDVAIWHKRGANVPSMLYKGTLRFLNNLSMGFLGNEIFKDEITMTMNDGSTRKSRADSGIPAGTHWGIVGVGLSMVVIDRVISFINGGRGVNIPGTHYKAIGN